MRIPIKVKANVNDTKTLIIIMDICLTSSEGQNLKVPDKFYTKNGCQGHLQFLINVFFNFVTKVRYF